MVAVLLTLTGNSFSERNLTIATKCRKHTLIQYERGKDRRKALVHGNHSVCYAL